MLSKRELCWILTLLSPKKYGLPFFVALMSVAGCKRYLQGPEPSPVILVQQAEMLCLRQFPSQMKSYLEDRIDATGVDQMTTCVQQALISFTKMTRGSAETHYSDEELRGFFNRYFLKENQISPALMREFMKLKMLFFGGNESQLARSEINKMIDLLEVLRGEGHAFLGDWKLLLFAASPEQVSDDRLTHLKEKIIRSVQNFFHVSNVDLSNYEWEDFQSFLQQLEVFLGGPGQMEVVRKWLPLIDKVKITFMGQKTLGRSGRDLDAQTEWAGRAYFLALEFHYHVSGLTLGTPSGTKKLVHFLDEVLDLVEGSPQIRQFGFIPFQSINSLLEEVWQLDLISTSVPVDVFKDAFRTAVWSFLEGRHGLSVTSTVSLDRRALAALRFEFNVWKLPVLFLAELFEAGGRETISLRDVQKQMHAFPIERVLTNWKQQAHEFSELRVAWNEYTEIMLAPFPPVWTDDGFLVVSPLANQVWVNFPGLVKTVTYRSLTRLLLRGYGNRESVNLWRQSVTMESLVALEAHFRPFGLATQFLDPRVKNPAARTFIEGNYFPRSSDGNQVLSAAEILEMMHLLFAGGQISSRKWIRDSSSSPSCFLDLKDVFGEPKTRTSCARQALRNYPEEFIRGMPGMVLELREMSEENFSEFFSILSELSRATPNSEQYSYADARGAMTLLYYIETLMLSFDLDYNGWLDDHELLIASNRFEHLLKKKEPKYWREGFVFILKKGRLPQNAEKLSVAFRTWFGKDKPLEPEFRTQMTGEIPGPNRRRQPPGTVGRLEILRAVRTLTTLL